MHVYTDGVVRTAVARTQRVDFCSTYEVFEYMYAAFASFKKA